MDIEGYIQESGAADPTWDNARRIVQHYLRIPDNLIHLIRSGYTRYLDFNDLIKLIGLTAMNPACILSAAELPTDGTRPRLEELEKAVQALGPRYCIVVLAINATVRSILNKKPTFGWRSLLQDLMTDIEIGYSFGARAGEIGLEGGMLAGFAKNAGLGILLAHDQKAFRKYHTEVKNHGRVGPKISQELFKCEPYQVSAHVMQQLGFGAEAAFGTACGLSELRTNHIDLGRDIVMWKAAFRWIDALRQGRNYPADMTHREFFPPLTPPKEQSAKNPTLEVLYTEVARVRREGSNWTWHLPRLDYERTKEAYGLQP